MSSEKTHLTPEQVNLVRFLDNLFDGSQTVFGLKDRQHRFLYVNSEVAGIIGHPPDEITGKKPDDYLLPDSARLMYQRHEEVMASGRPARYVDQVGIGTRTFTFATVCFPLKNDLGMVTSLGFVGVHVQDSIWLNAGMQEMLEKSQETILDLQRQIDDMRLQATTDPLTGVWNRVQAEVIGRQEMTRQDRSSSPVTIVFADLDHFKNVNDTWGHNIGDAVLIEFCRVVNESLRASDVLARWGGEEFVIILPDTDLDSAAIVAERIRYAIEQHDFEHIGVLTASFGVAAYIQGETWHRWVERADSALYRAKNKGRNRIELDTIDLLEAIPAYFAQASGFLRLAWRRSYDSGHPVVDRQHRQLFAHTNNLLSALLAGKPRENITILINGLLEAVSGHFHDEEQIIREAGFPGAEEHARLHSSIVRKAKRLARRYYDGRLELGELFSFLAYDVVATHMLVDDQEFFPYMNNPLAGTGLSVPKTGKAARKAGTAKTANATKAAKPSKTTGTAKPKTNGGAKPKARTPRKTAAASPAKAARAASGAKPAKTGKTAKTAAVAQTAKKPSKRAGKAPAS
ncbi:diguanylate cyclase [Oxalobacter sp. OttesenSCG-928-P03]|nr:diguanylate cyclase [Oxalobacter sp. OttesenSCG-928-P03]